MALHSARRNRCPLADLMLFASSFLKRLAESYQTALAAGFDAFTTEDFYETVDEQFKRLESESTVCINRALEEAWQECRTGFYLSRKESI